MDDRMSWDKYFLLMARLAGSRSTCANRKFGAVLTINNRAVCTGYNGSISGHSHCSETGCAKRKQGEIGGQFETCRAVHAEMNLIAQAARMGIPVEGGTLYCTASPCWSCFKVLENSGIARYVVSEIYDKICPEYEIILKGLIESGRMEVIYFTEEDFEAIDFYIRLPAGYRFLRGVEDAQN